MNGVAVIGMACRFPGARNPAEYWRNLRDGVESIARLSDAELLAAGVSADAIGDPHYVKAAGVLEAIEELDAAFFGLSPREAEVLDVQHRIFLECAWEALEDACCDPGRHPGSIGVYAGAGMNAYLLANLIPERDALASVGGFQALISNDKDYLPTRVSYKLNLRGPSVSVQTACSTSLVAVHLACQALLAGECDVALAGGVSVRVPQKAGYRYEEGMILSPDGRCRAFDARAAGTVPGSGAGVVVLKRLEDALADGDRVDAVVLGSAINNDGARKVGYTAPSVDGQRSVIREALAVAGVAAGSISFVEAHGTGTPLGDPIECAALAQALQSPGGRQAPCVLGAVKTNVGHLDTAAGVAGFMKAVLALRHGAIPPTLHFTTLNPQIDFAGGPFRVNATTEAWPSADGPRRAGVSSFGIGGTNAHVVLEEAPARAAQPSGRSVHALVLSARSERALDAHGQAVARALVGDGPPDLADVAWSLQTGRPAFEHRMAVVAVGSDRASAALARGEVERGVARARSVVFMFPGQGSQVPGMAAGLYALEPVFRETVDRCCETLRAPLGFDLRELLLAAQATADLGARLTRTAVAQPAIFVVEYALAQQLRAWGIEPSGAIGHSVGEYTAACVGGAVDLDDALMLLAERGRLMQQLPAGRMLAVRTTPETLGVLTNPNSQVPNPNSQLPTPSSRFQIPDPRSPIPDLAAINAPGLCVASGPVAAIDALARHCRDRGIETHDLQTSHAFHSAMMDPILDEFGRAIGRVRLSPPSIPWISNVTGTWVSDADAVDPLYWVRHLRQTVRFADGVACALGQPNPLLLEVGPGRALTTLALEQAGPGAIAISTMKQPRERSSDEETLARALSRLWVAGVDVKWEALDASRGRTRVSLPTYPFERQRYWIEPAAAARAEGTHAAGTGDARRRPLDEWFYVPAWRSAPSPRPSRDPRAAPWLVFARDGDEIGGGVIDRLRRNDATAIVVAPGDGFRRDGDARYVLRPGERDDYDALCADLDRRRIVPGEVIHAWCVDADVVEPDTDASPPAPPAAALDEGFFSLLWLARALGETWAADTRLHVLSSRVQSVAGEGVSPARAALLGPVHVIPRECPFIRCRSIDYRRPDAPGAAASLVRQLFAELLSDADDPLVAYRHHQRFVRTLERAGLAPAPATGVLRTGGHYLITGGLGGVGLVVAEHLARACRAKLTLVGRSAFPRGDEWGAWLATHAEDDGVSAKIGRLQAMEKDGARVGTAAADVADFDGLQRAVRQAEARFGPVHGVIHAAGVPGGGMLQRKVREEAEQILRPKVEGALNVVRLFEAAGIDFVVLMSSLTGVMGETGQIDYSAAGAFLDGLAHDRRGAGAPVCSIDWDTWREAGMAASVRLPGALQALRDESLRFGIGNDEGVEVLERVLASGLAQVVVSTREPRLRQQQEAIDAGRLASAVTPGRISPCRSRPRRLLPSRPSAASGRGCSASTRSGFTTTSSSWGAIRSSRPRSSRACAIR
jgi:acyl transferase domain-containing protein